MDQITKFLGVLSPSFCLAQCQVQENRKEGVAKRRKAAKELKTFFVCPSGRIGLTHTCPAGCYGEMWEGPAAKNEDYTGPADVVETDGAIGVTRDTYAPPQAMLLESDVVLEDWPTALREQ